MISEELMGKVWEAYQGDPMDPKNNTEAGLRRVIEVVLEHASTPSPSTHLRVKPLTFDKGINRTAKAFGATWMVWPYSDPLKDGLGNWLWQCVDAVPHTSGRCHSEDEAINAAQADYQRRVLDLLDNPPPQTNLPMSARVAFGLEAQGHIPAVEAAIAEGADWQEIGRRIGWDGETAKTYYERHLARLATTEGQPAPRKPQQSHHTERYDGID